MSFNLSDYIDVRQRVQLFHSKYPEGSLRFEFKGICEHDPEYIWGIAYAYRSPDDQAPAQGTAQELAIGRTNFTRGSTLQNLETSAWGRAISALGLGIDKAIASADEVRYAQERQLPDDRPTSEVRSSGGNAYATKKQLDAIKKMTNQNDYVVNYWKYEKGYAGYLTIHRASEFIEYFKSLDLAAKTRLFQDAKKFDSPDYQEQPPALPSYDDPWALPTPPAGDEL